MSASAKKTGCCGRTTITSRLRFTADSAVELTAEEVAFAAAMCRYRNHHVTGTSPTCGEVLDVLCDLGYVHPSRDFRANVKRFTKAIREFRETVQRFPCWSEVLRVAAFLGWHKPVSETSRRVEREDLPPASLKDVS